MSDFIDEVTEDSEEAAMPVEKIQEIPNGMKILENGIRSLHDRLTPILVAPIPTPEAQEHEPCSPMAEQLKLMIELISNIHFRLEL